MGGQIAFPGSVRASDSDRERAAAMLRRQYEVGRLSVGELEARLAGAYGATHRSELRGLLRDLPFEFPVDRRRAALGIDRLQRGLFRVHLWCFTCVNTIFLSMWAWGGGHVFWPALSLVPGGALLLWHRKGSRAATRRLSGGEQRRRRTLPAASRPAL